MKIAVGSDHGGFELKKAIIKHLEKEGHKVEDFGTSSTESCNYPLYGSSVAKSVASGENNYGIVVCTTGEGIMMTANKIKGIRCGLGYNDEVTRLIRQHNDANMISFGAKFMKEEDVLRRIDIFLNTEFEGGRHALRVDMIKSIEEK